ncbi:PREDICTED: zinc finger MYM-type protein 1-like [Erythranthe guttata]|uniref:zinc finger MYM-type protein 1-like n=1 Tax=Erythranthe guttata TaxID=4155 RepID=UPI00064DD89A|nr:PREDICTED: zinc finger MYM-type protein 1-like [Erythranthe guttata]|eukprot:XP_012833666.1 PREDICTED: zinc finger MYM-type protein 1-like [Erythranthe guttata]
MSSNQPKRLKNNTIHAFFQSNKKESSTSNVDSSSLDHEQERPEPAITTAITTVGVMLNEEFDINSLERDPGKRPQIWMYPVEKQDEIRRTYIKLGPYQFYLPEYPYSGNEGNRRRFQYAWFSKFPAWLEYSPTKDAAYCLPCFIFASETNVRFGANTFMVEGFRNWKKVNEGKNCVFLRHIGGHNSQHCVSLKSCEDLMNQSAHIDKVMQRQSSVEILNNRLRLKTSIDCVRWLAYQSCSFRGHDEGPTSKNSGNFREMVKLLANYNEKVAATILDKAPPTAKYISPTIQKEILHIIASKVRNKIREDIGDSKFCILVDEARDESKKEQMALVLRFVDKIGVLQERFFDIVSVKDTTSLTLKHELSTFFSHHALSIDNLRGQGYDGASNMRGEWNGLQALFLKDCPYAYYVHCFAHRLQLALVAASREVILVHQFFSKLDTIVNIVGASCKRTGELITAQQVEISRLISINELETGSGANQIGNLQRAGNTRWGSHFSSVCSLKKMFSATGSVLQTIISDGANYSQRGDADSAYTAMTSFQFVFILLLMERIMGVTDVLCQALQQRSQDILNAMHLVSTTKQLLQNLRDDGWNSFLNDVNLFCQSNEVEMPDMNYTHKVGRGKSIHQPRDTNITMEHHFHFDIFVTTIDTQMKELNCRFNEQTMELLTLSCALDPSDSFKSFKVDDICTLVEKYYPADFTEQDRLLLKFQLQHYHLDMTKHQDLCHLSTLAALCEGLTKTGKSKVYYLVDRLIRLILLLPVSTATTERVFSVMKLTKTRIRNKMEDGFLGDCTLLHMEKGIADLFRTYSNNRRILFERKNVSTT